MTAISAVHDEHGPCLILAFMPAATEEAWATAVIVDARGTLHEVALDTLHVTDAELARRLP